MKLHLCAIFCLVSVVSAIHPNDLKFYVEQAVKNTHLKLENDRCRLDFEEAANNGTVLWKMIDASAFPLGNGFLYSSGLTLGMYDECLEINHHYGDFDVIKGKFCAPLVALPYSILEMLFQVPISEMAPDLKEAFMLLSGCIPDSCSANDLKALLALEELPPPLNETLGGMLDTLIPGCVNEDTDKEFSPGDIVVISIFSLVLFLMIITTAYDVYLYQTEQTAPHPALIAFSVFTNGRKLFAISPKTNKEQVHVLNGLKFISMMWVVAGHGFAAFNATPVMNREEVMRWQTDYRYPQYIYTAPLAVDTFFFISGFLLAYMYLKPKVPAKADKQILSIPYMIIHRYLRLTPALLMVYLMTITFFKHLGNGPLFHSGAAGFRDTCTKYWYSFFLYIQNYYNKDEICLTQTWYLSADMQLFVLSPLIIIPISLFVRKSYKLVMMCLGVLNVIFIFLPLIIKLTVTEYYNNYDTHSRLCDYSLGITLAVYMRMNMNKPYPFSKRQNFMIWVFIIAVMLTTFFCYEEMILNWTLTGETVFHSSMRPMLCLSLSWIIFSCQNGFGGIVNWILTRSVFQVGSRLSYCMYLLHGNIVGYWVLTLRNKVYFTDYNEYLYWCGHFLTSMVAAVIWSLAFESPMITIEKLIFGGSAPKKPGPTNVSPSAPPPPTISDEEKRY